VYRSRGRLSPADRYTLDALWAEARGDYMRALRAAREMARAAPTSVAALLLVGWQATRVNRPAEAVAALRRLDPERPAIRSYPGYWDVLTQAHHLRGDYRAELAAAQHGGRQHPDHWSSLYNQARAVAALGHVRDVARRLDEIAGHPVDAGRTPVQGIIALSGELRVHGHPAAADAALARVLRWYDGRPAAEHESPTFRARHAEALYAAGRWEEARRRFERLAGERAGEGTPGGRGGPRAAASLDALDGRGYLGVLAARRGDAAAARGADSALAAMRTPFLLGRHTYWRARIAALLGERERAVALLREALQQGRTYVVVHTEADFAALRDIPAFQELVRPKG
jgi:tetratricopeptide (TPR) repeat protein